MLTASICVATFNKPRALRRVLASIYAQRVPFDFEVIVADDGSPTDETQEIVRLTPATYVRLDECPAWRNPAAARNAAYARATGDVVIAQSDDVLHVTPDAIARLVHKVQERPCVAVATVHDVDLGGKIIRTYTSPDNQRPYLFLGALRRADILAIGGNDEDFTAAAFEDQWFADCLVHGLGRDFVWVDDVIGHHQHHQKVPKQIESRELYNRKVAAAEQDPRLWRAWSGRLCEVRA